MTYRIEIDGSACNGYGNCVITAPDVFDLDPVTGIATVVPGHPDDDVAVAEAEADCPARAIRLSRP